MERTRSDMEPDRAAPIEPGATILVVDDEEPVLRVAEEILSYLGFRVETARSGEEALERVVNGLAPDIILLDVVLPGMGGVETFARIHRYAPQIPILITSGYANRGAIEWLIEEGARGFLAKPFGMEALSERIRAAMSG